MEEWKDVPVSIGFTLERVEQKSLPTLIGRNASLDKRISEILTQTEKKPFYWLMDEFTLLSISQYPENKLLECHEIEVEIEGKSTGYFDPGMWGGRPENSYPPEQDDERELTKVTFIYYDENYNELGKMETDNPEEYDRFLEKLYEAFVPLQDDY